MSKLKKIANTALYELSSIWKFKVEHLEENEYYSNEDLYEYNIHDCDEEIVENAIKAIERSFNESKNDLEQYCEEDLGFSVVFELDIDEEYLNLYVTTEQNLTEEQKAALKDWWDGQLSDGWGEGLDGHSVYEDKNRDDVYICDYIEYDEYCEALGYDTEEVGEDYYDDYRNETVENVTTDVYCVDTFSSSFYN